MRNNSSYKQILRSSSIIGGASFIGILIGLLRTKVVAILLGPSGIGLVGLFQNLIATATSISALGFGVVGTRQIAEASGKSDEIAVAGATRALFWGTMCLAIFGGVIFWLLRNELAVWVLNNEDLSSEVGWLSLGVALGVASGSQTAFLNGFRRIGDLAWISIASAVMSTFAGVLSLFVFGRGGLVFFVLAAPLSNFILGHWFVAKLQYLKGPKVCMPILIAQWKTMARLGVVFMVSGLAITLGQLLIRTLIQRELGVEALGHFQAAWVISVTYIGFVLSAMGRDYYPRLTASIFNHEQTKRLINEQTEVALLLSGPLLLGMMSLSPWVIEILYSSEFSQASGILRWQVIGNILKLISWPLGFVILAVGDGRSFMASEVLSVGAFAIFTWIGLPFLGIEAAGIGFVLMYVVCFPYVFFYAKRRIGFVWDRNVVLNFSALILASLIVFIVGEWSLLGAGGVGLILTLCFCFHSLMRLGEMVSLTGRFGKLASVSRKVMKKLRVERD